MTTYTLAEIGTIYDGPHATPERTTVGPYFLNIASLQNGRLDLAESDHVSEEHFAQWTRRVTPRENDLLFSYETRLGEAALMPSGVRACLGRRMALLRPDIDVVDPHFLLYLYMSPTFKQLIDTNTIHGATVNRIGLATMGRWTVGIPERRVQEGIAGILGALDDKIAANARLIHVASLLASAVFDAAAITEDTLLSRLARFVNGKAYTKDATGTGRVVVRIAELNSGIGASTVRNDINVPDDNVAVPGDLLFAWSGSLTVHRWYRSEAIVNQHIFKVVPLPPYPIWLVQQILLRKLNKFRAIAADRATTMGHIQRHHLDETVGIPELDEIERLHPLMNSLWSTALEAEQEFLYLTDLRDTLLPQLISGRLRVKDAELQAEDVV